MASYLLEIGCEEIPAGFINPSVEYLKNEFIKKMDQLSIPYDSVLTGGTPRRLFLNVEGISHNQIEKVEVIMGPPAKIAFTETGDLTEAAKKFATSKEIDILSLKRVTTPKGDYLQGEKTVGGGKTADILAIVIPDIIKSMPFPKSMKWGNNDFKFVRPIHWFLSIFDKEVLHFEAEGIKASNKTKGHRFLAPDEINISSFSEYKDKLEEAFVIINSEKRREIIKSQIKDIEKANNIIVDIEGDLLDTVVDLVEYPYLILGEFQQSFLELPEEVLITSMKVHQKYFPVRDKNGSLLNKFAGVANIKSPNGDEIIRQGYERVLKARLNDAVFFYDKDKKVKLESRAEDLKKVVYQEKLGTSYEKMERFRKNALYLADILALDKKSSIEKTAYLCKADLLSEMVYEFPELQGIMGSYYALFEGIDKDIAMGIKEHYQPRFAGDNIPLSMEGKIVSIADKIDTIAGVFAINMKPTGNVDPYGLRRSAIGILSIIEESNFRLDLKALIEYALSNMPSHIKINKEELTKEILSFINLRFKQMLVSREISAPDVFDAVSSSSYDPLKIKNLSHSLSKAKGSSEFQIIASSFKRINNIIKKNEWNSAKFTKELLECDEEKALAELVISEKISTLIKQEENEKALAELMKFAPVVNNFFENVMVMAENKEVRENRLGLITSLRDIFLYAGDLEAIAVQ